MIYLLDSPNDLPFPMTLGFRCYNKILIWSAPQVSIWLITPIFIQLTLGSFSIYSSCIMIRSTSTPSYLVIIGSFISFMVSIIFFVAWVSIKNIKPWNIKLWNSPSLHTICSIGSKLCCLKNLCSKILLSDKYEHQGVYFICTNIFYWFILVEINDQGMLRYAWSTMSWMIGKNTLISSTLNLN